MNNSTVDRHKGISDFLGILRKKGIFKLYIFTTLVRYFITCYLQKTFLLKIQVISPSIHPSIISIKFMFYHSLFPYAISRDHQSGVKTEIGQYWFLRTSAPWEVLVRNQSALVRIFTIP